MIHKTLKLPMKAHWKKNEGAWEFEVAKVIPPSAPKGFGFKYAKFVKGKKSAPDVEFVFKRRGY